MSNNKQSSVDKLWDDVKGWIPQGQYAGVREYYLEAKAMHKEEIIDAFWQGDNSNCTSEQNEKEFAEKYYEQTYGGNNEQQ